MYLFTVAVNNLSSSRYYWNVKKQCKALKREYFRSFLKFQAFKERVSPDKYEYCAPCISITNQQKVNPCLVPVWESILGEGKRFQLYAILFEILEFIKKKNSFAFYTAIFLLSYELFKADLS